MGKKAEKDELEDVETIPRAQAEKEIREAARNVQKGSHAKASEEEEEVTPATRKQAKEELREAVKHVQEEEHKKHAGSKGRS